MKRQAKHGAVEAFEDSSQIVIYMQIGKDCRQENVDNHAGDDWKKIPQSRTWTHGLFIMTTCSFNNDSKLTEQDDNRFDCIPILLRQYDLQQLRSFNDNNDRGVH